MVLSNVKNRMSGGYRTLCFGLWPWALGLWPLSLFFAFGALYLALGALSFIQTITRRMQSTKRRVQTQRPKSKVQSKKWRSIYTRAFTPTSGIAIATRFACGMESLSSTCNQTRRRLRCIEANHWDRRHWDRRSLACVGVTIRA